ncbi:MAG: Rab family GTPase [Candidatus Hodarchaeales archaeon]|jgi:small GTP-binding protein
MALIAKICLLGDGKVGKTSLVNRYLEKGFLSDYLPTLGSDFTSKEIHLETDYGPKEIRFQIWDLAGQPNYGQIRRVYYKGSIGAFLVFDLTNPKSLENLVHWVQEFSDNAGVHYYTLIMLANKSDLKNEIMITPQDVEKAIKAIEQEKGDGTSNQVHYFETSAKTGQNVTEAFEFLGHSIVNNLYG